MNFSFMALNRLVEEHAAKDESLRRQLERNGKCLLSDGRALSDEALLEKLRSLGLTGVGRDWLDHVSRKVPSAEGLATVVTEHGGLDIREAQEDWVWIALVCLWERWFPDRPNFEMLDDRMHAGYQMRDEKPVEAVRQWLQMWQDFQLLMENFEIETLEEFDESFGGSQSVFNWVQDFSDTLHRAALTDRSFARRRLALCRDMLALAEKSERDRKLVGGFRKDLAESHADLGDYETVDDLYTHWLNEDPQCGWGWIAWSDLYYLFAPGEYRDAVKAERILKDGLAVPDVREREQLTRRLATLFEETGRPADAAAVRNDNIPSPHIHEEATREPQREQTPPHDERYSDLDTIIAELDAEYTSKTPEQALRAAQRRREEITPRLIDLMREATEAVRAGNDPPGDGHLFALFLLTEFEARDALPAILEAVSLPDERPIELFGDAVTEDLPRVLAALAAETPEVVDELIANRSLNRSVRWAAASTYLLWVRDGLLTREQAVARLREHLSEAVINRDDDVAGELVCELVSYAPHEALEEIAEAYDCGLVDELLISLESIKQHIAEGQAWFQEELRRCRPTGVHDTVAELQSWYCFQEQDVEEDHYGAPLPLPVSSMSLDEGDDWRPDLEAGEPWEEQEEPWETVAPIRNTAPKIGRNDSCPCGSGKKYKKCCRAK